MIECTVHLISLQPNTKLDKAISQVKAGKQKILITGCPHGWIHKPHSNDVIQLTGSQWHYFALTVKSNDPLRFDESVEAHVSIDVAIPEEEYKQLSKTNPTHQPQRSPPELPADWIKVSNGDLQIPPPEIIVEDVEDDPPPGTLQMTNQMFNFLSRALPNSVRQKPVSLFNLFKYRNGDSTVHEQYMRDFKENFGDSAGAFVKFMGPVKSQIKAGDPEREEAAGSWQEANLTHYDSIFHYAYMLSTGVYQKLNKDKVRGLEDTCILLVSEVELLAEDWTLEQLVVG